MSSSYKKPYGYSSTAFDVDDDIEEQPLELEDWMFEGSEPQYKPNPYEDLSYWTKYGKKNARQSNRILNRERRAENVDNRRYDANVFMNTIKAPLKNVGLWDSGLKLYEKKRDTPDYSGLNTYQYKAMQETPVLRYSPTHVTSSAVFNPRDYTELGNRIQAQSVAAQNLASRQGRGNTNLLMAHLNNLLSNTNKQMGDAYRQAWADNEAQRMAVAKEHRAADETNATFDNNAESAYINARNAQTAADKRNALNALQYVDQQKYARNMAHQHQVDAARDEFISNLGTYGENAYNANEANTDQSYNYWKDAFGRLHYNGGKPYDYNLALDNDIWQSVYDNAPDDEKAKLNGMTRQQRRNYIVDKLYKANA